MKLSAVGIPWYYKETYRAARALFVDIAKTVRFAPDAEAEGAAVGAEGTVRMTFEEPKP